MITAEEQAGRTELSFSEEGLKLFFERETHRFLLTLRDDQGREKTFAFKPGRFVTADEKEFSLAEADPEKTEVKIWEKGRGAGIDVLYKDFGPRRISFICRFWLPAESEALMAEWIPLDEGRNEGPEAQRFYWPVPELQDSGYVVLPLQQGVIIPYSWPNEVMKIPFDGQFCTSSAYMPWVGQVGRKGAAWQMIAETPYDGGYKILHPAGGPTKELSFYWLKSLGKWREKRVVRLYFDTADCDYNKQAKRYRAYVKEIGHFTSLAEKIRRNPTVEKLIGAAVVHMGIKTHVAEDSSFFDPKNPEKNDSLVTFAEREKEVRELMELGAGKFYFHVDGWGEPGYDNKHPDIFPVCKEAGGMEGLLKLARTVREGGNLIGLHDQYRDYYFSADSFSRDEAVTDAEGKNPEHARWAGGHQTYLCGTLAPYYLKRNFGELMREGFKPDCSYLDVFTCNEPDECFSKEHPASRRDCLEGRLACFAWLNSQGIVPSSEECTDWAMRELVFCHYGPHHFMLQKPGTPRSGLPVPLFNLVYHDAMMLPWPMEPAEEFREDMMLYALLNAGMPYLIRDAAYPGIDGAFSEVQRKEFLKAKIERTKVVQRLQARLAHEEMVSHHFLDTDGPSRQETVFGDGTRVLVDFAKGEYAIQYPED